jgi:hypothetical protein
LKAIIFFISLIVCIGKAAAEQVVFIAETPYLDLSAVAAGEASCITRSIMTSCVSRASCLVNGLHAAEIADAHAFQNADIIVQMMTGVSTRGYRVNARLYHKQRKEWFTILSKLFSTADPQPLVDRIIKDVFPRMVIQVLELTHSEQRPVLFVDCLVPPDQDPELQQLARSLTLRYGNTLSARPGLQQNYAVVRLVPTVHPTFFGWWCTLSQVPRSGLVRSNTTTIYGFIEQIHGPNKPSLSLEVRRQDGRSQIDQLLSLDMDQNTVNRIVDLAEGLAHGM